ncbi:MAG TPA: hypothetical protein VD704_07120 [Gaiellaceae bacterium]|nr:hypothetical protein [Gaiellaceae bacterium]
MTATKEEIGARVDALANVHEGDAFVEAVRELADELGPEGKPLLHQVLLERAADEEDFQQAVRRRFAERGWTRRTLARVERLWRDDRADSVAAALEAGEAGAEGLARELDGLRRERGRAALVLDELSRHPSPRVRAWVPGAAADLLGEQAERLVLSLTRDRDELVREAAVAALVALGPDGARSALPDLRRKLRSPRRADRVRAMWALAELRDEASFPVLSERAEAAESAGERNAARAALLALRGDEAAIAAGLSEHDHEQVPALAAAARILRTETTVAALRDAAAHAPDEECRAACAAELERIEEDA